jgi:hypothetical protein
VKAVWEMAKNAALHAVPEDADEAVAEPKSLRRVKKPVYAAATDADEGSPPPAARIRRSTRGSDKGLVDPPTTRRSTRISETAATSERASGPIPGDDEL